MNNALKQSLNQIREISSTIYHEYIPVIDDATDISKFAEPILNYPVVYNEFCNTLVNKLVYSQFESMTFNNPLRVLEGDAIPLGYAGEHGYVNPAKARGFNVNDFAGLLVKYEADVKIEYATVNSDLQYCVTISRQQLKKAMTSWANLEEFITSLSNSLYNGAYIDMFRFTKNIISGAYKDNKAVIETIDAISDTDTAKAFVERARELYLNMQLPSSSYNAWTKNDGKGRPVVTWSKPEDIVLVIKNSLRAKLDVDVLASAFNMDKATLLGNIITVDDFDGYDDDGEKVYDGSNIIGFIGDKKFFRIKTQDMYMENFANPNNRTMNYYLNVIRMYNFSLFANGVIFATAEPTNIPFTSLSFGTDEVVVNETEGLDIIGTPSRADAEITYESSNDQVFTVEKDDDNEKHCTVTAVGVGSAVLTATSGDAETKVIITVESV